MAEATGSSKDVSDAPANDKGDDNATSADPAAEVAELARLLPRHPDIFEQHPELLESIELRHASGGAISLIERQVSRLRDSNDRLRGQLDGLIATASENESRIGKLMNLAGSLLEAASLQAFLEGLGRRLEADFGISRWVLYHEGSEDLQAVELAQVRSVPADGELRGVLENALRTGRIECKAMDESVAATLFDETAPEGSVAIVPMQKQLSNSILVLGSADADKFRPESGAMLLDMLAGLIASGLRRFPAAGESPE